MLENNQNKRRMRDTRFLIMSRIEMFLLSKRIEFFLYCTK